MLSAGDDEQVHQLISSVPLSEQLRCLSMVKDWKRKAVYSLKENKSVLDSGASRHMHGDTTVLDPHNRVSVVGFDGGQDPKRTQGNDCLPVELIYEASGEPVKLDVCDVDLMHGLMSNLLSMGKLMRLGWEFHFTDHGRHCWGTMPGG